jgi:hypothetical protein
MELIIGIVLAVLGIIATAASRQLADEFKAWTPWITEWLVRRAAHKLPEKQRDRCEEEWLSHIYETPGEVGKLIAAIGFLFAARKISSNLMVQSHPGRWFDIVASVAGLYAAVPLFPLIATVIKLEDGGPILVKATTEREGRKISFFEFRTVSLGATPKQTRAGRFLIRTGFVKLPLLIHLLRGDVTLVLDRVRRRFLFAIPRRR